MCFIAVEKAFDRVKHTEMIALLQQVGIDDKGLRIIQNLHWHQRANIWIDQDISEEVEILKGVRQGCIF